MRYKLLLLVTFIVHLQTASAQTEKIYTAKYSNDFTNIGVGGRGLGMGNSVVASVSDVTAAYWNPAALTCSAKQIDAALMHSEYFAGISKFDYLGASYKLNDSATIAFSAFRLGVDEIPNTLSAVGNDNTIDPNRVSYFSVADYAFLFSYAKLTAIRGLSLGANAKIIYRNQGEFAKAIGFGFDLGMRYKTGRWVFGAMAKDVSSTFNAWVFNTDSFKETFELTDNELPVNSVEITLPSFVLASSYTFNITDKISALAEADLSCYFAGERHTLLSNNVISLDPHIGLEGSYQDMVFLRLGVNNVQHIQDFEQKKLSFQPSVGLGIKLFDASLDYAYTDVGDQSIALYSHVISLRYTFNQP